MSARADMSALSLADWLVVLKNQLTCLHTDGVTLIEGLDVDEGPNWCDGGKASTAWTATSPAIARGHTGWLIGLNRGQPRPRHLFVATNRQLGPDDPCLALGAAICRFALSLRQEQDNQLALSREPMHDLRNGLNSVAMTAAVLVRSKLPDALQPFADDLQDSVQCCLQALRQLSAVVEPAPSRWREPAVAIDAALVRETFSGVDAM